MKKLLILVFTALTFATCDCPECNDKLQLYPGEIERIARHSSIGGCYLLKYDGHEYIIGPGGKTIIHSESCPCHSSISNGLGW